MSEGTNTKLWGGRFSGKTDSLLEKLNASIAYDKRMWYEDIQSSQAYALALQRAGFLTEDEEQTIQEGLRLVSQEWELDNFKLHQTDEDIHTAIERRLKELIGLPATKLHLGRSRNDQVATDMKLWLRSRLNTLKKHIQHLTELVKKLLSTLSSLVAEQCFKDMNFTTELSPQCLGKIIMKRCDAIITLLKNNIKVLVERAKAEVGILMPGYTHLQRAQPVQWSHWLLSYAWYLKEDCDRLLQLQERMNVMPLGSGALAGNPFSINRSLLAKDLGFAKFSYNSMNAVGNRDFIAEFLFWASLTAIHLSQLAEDLILYSTKEFGFVSLSDSYCTGSSLMPQKKNPDSLELIRGRAGRICGNNCGFMMVLKGLPSTYNKDLQEDKEAMFDTYDNLECILQVALGTVKTLVVNEESCSTALSPDMLATDLAYYLVRKGIAFRESHHIAGEVVALAEKLNMHITSLTLQQLKSVSDKFEDEVLKVWDYKHSVEQYQTVGGTSTSSIAHQIHVLLEEWLHFN